MAKSYYGDDGRLRPGWRILRFVGLFYLFAITGTLIVRFSLRGGGIDPAVSAAIKGLLVVIAATLSVVIARRRLDRRSFASLGLDRAQAGSDLLFGFAVGGGFVALAIGVQAWLGWATVQVSSASLATLILLFIGTAAGIAWFEEIVFRGYLFQNAVEGLGQTRAIVVMTVVSGLVHVLNPHAGVVSTLIVAAIGLQHIVAYLWSKQLWLAIGTHAGWNFFQGAVFGLSVSGRPTDSLFKTTFHGPAWASGGSFGIEAGVFGVVWAFGGMLVIWLWCRRRTLPPTALASASAP